VVELESVEFILEVPHLLTISRHLGVQAARLFHDDP
jgi:hypothetical protein